MGVEMGPLQFPNEPNYFVAQQFDRLLLFCCENKASDITFQTGEVVFAEIHGRQCRTTQRVLSLQELSDIIKHVYGANATAMIFSGNDIDTHYRLKVDRDVEYRFRVNITACYFDGYQGMQMTLRVISSQPPLLETLGVEAELLPYLKVPQGIIVVSGATGSGKSTLLASVVADICMQEDANMKVLTYEAPIEYVYNRVKMPTSLVSQVEIPRNLASFAAGVRNALRRKPGLILVGEARDQETIEAVIEAALTGHPVYTTVHSNGVADTLRRMIMIFPYEARDSCLFDLLETIKVVIWQALLPRPDGKRTAVREYLVFTNEVRDALLKSGLDALVGTIRSLLPKYGQPIMRDVEKKYKEGLLTEEAYQRFFLMEQKHG
ncbi:MAG: ATPase, T2SS/T4P/T4SS family [Gammaproteobacteria bacterium]|jgi:defect-in-organelle-trafficking protein DotB|nr:ATPase, T2SS/T4P/T4SS family [Gammaproteobacteria bacterium]